MSTDTEDALVTSLRPGDWVRVEGEVCRVMTLPLRSKKYGGVNVLVERADKGTFAGLTYPDDLERVEVLERAPG